MKGHLKHMLIGGAAILAVLLVAGVDFGQSLQWAILLACPLMMVGMMLMMNRKGGSHEHDHGGSHSAPSRSIDSDSAPAVRAEPSNLN